MDVVRYSPLLAALMLTAVMAEENIDLLLLDGFKQTTPSTEATIPARSDLLSASDETSPAEADANPTTPSKLELFGSLSLQGEYGYAHDTTSNYHGLSHLKFGIDMGFDYRLNPKWQAHAEAKGVYDTAYQLNGRANFLSSVLNNEELELNLGEAWIRGELAESIDIKLGRQIVVWGKSDILSVTNILNPIDNRALGMVDIKDLRLPLTMAKFDYYFQGIGGDWDISAIVIPQISFNKVPVSGSEYYVPLPAAEELIPKNGVDNSELALAVNATFSGWDLSLYRADTYDDTPYLTTENGSLQLLHSRIQMNGIAMNSVKGNWLLKGELAQLRNLRYSNIALRYQRTDVLLGLEYAGIKDTHLSLELMNRKIMNHDSALQASGINSSSQKLALSLRNDRMHNRLHLVGLILLTDLSTDNGGIVRLSGEYELSDNLAVTVGLVDYVNSSTLPFSAIEDNDRIFTELEYNF